MSPLRPCGVCLLLDVFIVGLALLSGCAGSGSASGDELDTERQEVARNYVEVSGLVLEVDHEEEGVRFYAVVRAKRAVFDDLPGRGGGQLEGVELRIGAAGERGSLRAEADRARLRPDGAIMLEDAEITQGSDSSLRLTARRAEISPERSLQAQGVHARLRLR